MKKTLGTIHIDKSVPKDCNPFWKSTRKFSVIPNKKKKHNKTLCRKKVGL